MQVVTVSLPGQAGAHSGLAGAPPGQGAHSGQRAHPGQAGAHSGQAGALSGGAQKVA